MVRCAASYAGMTPVEREVAPTGGGSSSTAAAEAMAASGSGAPGAAAMAEEADISIGGCNRTRRRRSTCKEIAGMI